MSSPLPARDILAAYRDLGSRRETVAEAALSCDPNFNRYTSYWLIGETLDSTYAALAGLRLLSQERAREFIEDNRSAITDFLMRHFDAESCTFTTDSSQRTRGIFAFHSAIGVIKSLTDPRSHHASVTGDSPGRHLGISAYGAVLLASEVKVPQAELAEAVVHFVEQAAEASPLPGSLLDSPGSPLPPSLTVLYTAYMVLWNLFDREEARQRLLSILDEGLCRRFIAGCIETSWLGEMRLAGFTIHPASSELCSNTTFFGLTLLDRLGILHEVLTPELRQGMVNFIRGIAFHGDGFRSTLGEEPSLNATFFSLRALRLLLGGREFRAFAERNTPRIRGFVERCTSEVSGGSAFTSDFGRYVENGLATRYGIQILHILDRATQAGDGGREREPPFARESEEAAFSFLESLYNPRSGGFRGYPPERIAIEETDPGCWLEKQLARKDEAVRLHLAHPGLEADFEIDGLYRDLAAACARREAGEGGRPDEEVEEILVRLRKLQAEEADRFWQEANTRLSMPLDYGQTRLMEARRLRERYEGLATDAPPSSAADSSSTST